MKKYIFWSMIVGFTVFIQGSFAEEKEKTALRISDMTHIAESDQRDSKILSALLAQEMAKNTFVSYKWEMYGRHGESEECIVFRSSKDAERFKSLLDKIQKSLVRGELAEKCD